MEEHTEIVQQQEEFTQDAGEVAKLAASQSALVPYVPKSKNTKKFDTLIPKNMAFEVQKSLNRIVKEKGNIDNYVRNELKYISTTMLWEALAAEQVDGVALYLKQFERRQGIIIADQTGIGKGRQAAAVIRHAILHDYLPIFFTRSTNLFTDIYRDLENIHFEDIRPFILNTDNRATVKDEDGQVVFSPLSAKDQLNVITYQKTYPTESAESIGWHKEAGRLLPDLETTPEVTITYGIDYLPSDYDVIFTTYSQVQSAHPYKRNWLQQLCENGVEGSKKHKEVVLILDESHMAGGYDSKIGNWMRTVLPIARACCFLSATFAKYPEVMPFYGKKTAILETGLSDDDLVNAMKKGGLALQEIVASNLCESGQLIRRQRSNKGIEIEYVILNKEPARSRNRERVNRIITLMNDVVRFERDYINDILGDIHEEAKSVDESVKQKPKGLGVKQAPYFSRVFNVIDQMLFALKVEEVAKNTLELLKQDKKVVIAFKSTMGAFLKEMKLATGDVIAMEELNFSRTLIKGLDSVLAYSYTNIIGEKSRKHIAIDALPQSGIDEYHRIKKEMLLENSGLTISPIDQLIHLIEKEAKPKSLGGHDTPNFKVAEVTGRNQKLFFEEDEAIVSSFRSDTEKSFRLFNSGDYDVLLINQSGSTGASAHSSVEFKDQRQRIMISHQFELDINIEVQKIGRINRTGQVNLPGYRYIASDIPMEVRLMTMLKGKLKSLDANTTGSQKTSDSTFQSPDLFNKYGDLIAWQWVDENPDLAKKLGNPTYRRVWGELKRSESKEGAIRQVTGRAGLLYVEEQEALFNDLIARYNHQIVIEKQQGTYDLETEFLQLDADVKKRFLQYQGNGGNTPFGKDTVREQTIVNNLQRPFTKNEVDERITKRLEGKTPERLQFEFTNVLKTAYPELMESRKEKRMEVIAKMELELSEMPEEGSGSDDPANEKIAILRERQQARIDEKHSSLNTYMAELEDIQRRILRYVGYWRVGEVLKVPFVGSIREGSWGIFMGVRMGKNNTNPYTLSNISFHFAVVDGRKSITYDLKNGSDYLAGIYAESKEIEEEAPDKVLDNWNELIKEASSKREKRFILTENILAVSEEIDARNKLIKYNTTTGTIKNGILMSREYGKDGEHFALLPISEGLKVIEGLDTDTSFKDHKYGVKFKRVGETYFEVYINKKQHYKLPLDPALRKLIMRQQGQTSDELPEFIQNAGDMVGVLSLNNVLPFLKILDEYGFKIEGEAKELEDWEIENISDWEERTVKGDQRYHYELGRSYGNGSNPQLGFTDYKEPDTKYPFGTVEYDRVLQDKEKYNYSLIPIFKNIEVPYLEWKKSIKGTPIADDFKEAIKKARTLPVYKAIDLIGYFITNHPHEDGNPEFVFGRYTSQDFGKATYEDIISPIGAIDILLDKLQLEYKLLVA